VAAGLPEIQIAPEQAAFLQLLLRAINAHTVVEVGTLAARRRTRSRTKSTWRTRPARPRRCSSTPTGSGYVGYMQHCDQVEYCSPG
jgi:hypothetical protein